jgi:hypothetical protein
VSLPLRPLSRIGVFPRRPLSHVGTFSLRPLSRVGALTYVRSVPAAQRHERPSALVCDESSVCECTHACVRAPVRAGVHASLSYSRMRFCALARVCGCVNRVRVCVFLCVCVCVRACVFVLAHVCMCALKCVSVRVPNEGSATRPPRCNKLQHSRLRPDASHSTLLQHLRLQHGAVRCNPIRCAGSATVGARPKTSGARRRGSSRAGTAGWPSR